MKILKVKKKGGLEILKDSKVIGKYLKNDKYKNVYKYTERTKETTEVHIERVLQGGKTCTAKIKYKPGPKESPVKWIFFGLASY